MKYKLICLDIDGTLLDDEKRIPIQVKQSLKKVSGMGISIALISGRMPAAIDIIEEELGITCIKACNAGTYILTKENRISAEYLSNNTMRNINRNISGKYKIPLWIFRDKKWFVTGMDPYVEREIKTISYQPEFVDAEVLAEQWEMEGKRPNKLLVAAEPKTIKKIHEEMAAQAWEDIDMACSDAAFLEIFPKGTNKGKAVDKICNYLNIEPKEVIAFGDQELDIPMIEAAGTGIAMGNAIDELKEKADFVTRTNNEAGIVYALEHYLTQT